MSRRVELVLTTLASLAMILAACTPRGAVGAAPAGSAGAAQDATPAECSAGAVERTLHVETSIYGGTDRVLVDGPACPSGSLNVLYLLHGAGADASQWLDVGAFAALDALQERGRGDDLLIVVPDASTAYRCSTGCGADLARHLLDEVEPLALGDGTRVARRAIGGISRGGGLAFAAVAAAPGRFSALGGHSPAGLAGVDVTAPGLTEIPIWVDVGEGDSLAGPAAQAAEDLRAAGGSVTYRPAPGSHDRDYWRSRTPEYLDWYVSELEGARG